MLVEPPRNGGYLAAAYIVAPTILLGYWLRLLRLARRLRETQLNPDRSR